MQGNCRESADFFRNCYFNNQVSDKSAENSKNTLFLDAYLYYNRKRNLLSETFSGTNSEGNVPGNSPGGKQNAETVPETVPLSGNRQEQNRLCKGGKG